MPITPRWSCRVALVAAVSSALLAGCSRHEDDRDEPATPIVATRRPASAQPDPLRAGDVRIVTADSGIDLALIGDSISSGLSPYALARVRRETDTATVRGSGFGASIERMVKGAVAGAVGTRVAFPISAVRDVRYEGGRLEFDWAGKPTRLFDNTKVNGRPVLESFNPADAQRFVSAVRARKAAGR